MHIALIADTFPPLRSSGSVQLRDLAREFKRQGHSLCVLLPAADQCEAWKLELFDDTQVLRLRAPRIKEVSYARRTLAEFAMPFAMLRNFFKSPLANQVWDAVVWYSPSIFHGPFVSVLSRSSNAKSYLIIRDIFPEWAVDMGLIKRGFRYWFFDAIARYQYSVADVIGVQSSGNQQYFEGWLKKPGRRLEVLQNWLGKPSAVRCSIRVDETALVGRKVFVYAGNMGVAQGTSILLELAEKLRIRPVFGFLFVGRGSDVVRLKDIARSRQLDNVVFFDEIDPDEIPDLYAQCHAGIVALDPRHKSHNIPGKFLSYMQSGLPVLANINPGNDLAQIIRDERVGQVCETHQVGDLLRLTENLLDQVENDLDLPERCLRLFERNFSVANTVKQIINAVSCRCGESPSLKSGVKER
jgi:glycosyltransferase involved in cell wall biosynthesis